MYLERLSIVLVFFLALPASVLEAQAPYEPPKEIFTPTPQPESAPSPQGSEGAPAGDASQTVEQPVVQEQPTEPPPPPTFTARPKVIAPPPIEVKQWRYGEDGQIEWGAPSAGGDTEEGQAPVEEEPVATPTRPVGKTTLRAEQPKGTFLRGNYTVLSAVTVRIRNQGIYDAKNVVVYARLPGSKNRILLLGPRELAPGSTAEYSGSASEIVRVAGNIQIEPTCENCRN